MKDQENYIAAVRQFNRYLEEHGLRKTPERFTILKGAWTAGGHFTVDELYGRLESERFHVSRSTLYHTVNLLIAAGLMRRHQFGTGEACYEPVSGNHLHLICTRCGRISEAPGGEEAERFLSECASESFSPMYWTAYIYGVCKECSGRQPLDNQ